MEKVFFVIVSGYTDRDPVVLKNYPSEQLLTQLVSEMSGTSVRIEERYVTDHFLEKRKVLEDV